MGVFTCENFLFFVKQRGTCHWWRLCGRVINSAVTCSRGNRIKMFLTFTPQMTVLDAGIAFAISREKYRWIQCYCFGPFQVAVTCFSKTDRNCRNWLRTRKMDTKLNALSISFIQLSFRRQNIWTRRRQLAIENRPLITRQNDLP